MQKSMNQMIPLANQLNGLNNKLVSQITCEQKSHADLNAKQLKEIESLKSMVKSLESIISSMQKDSSLKDSDIISLGTKINELEAELEQATQKVLLKDSDTNQLCSNPSLEIKAKELENELEKVTQNSSFKDGLIFCLRSRIPLKSHLSSNDSKTELEPDERKVKNEVESPIDHTEQKSKEKLDSNHPTISPITTSRSGKALISNEKFENKNTKFQSTIQKRSKTEIPPMKLRLLNMDEVTEHESSRNVGHPAMTWTFAMVVTGKSGTGKTNLLANLVLGDKDEYMQKGKKGGSRYIRCDDLIICGYHPDEPKWAYVRYIYNMILKDPRAPYYEDISFSYILFEKIPSTKVFSPKRSTLIIFEDVCLAPENIQNRIGQFFGNGRHQNISCVYVMQKYHKFNTFTRENTTHLVVFNSGSSHEDISKIIRRYTDDVKNASMVINSYLRKEGDRS
uniref:Uncharacterized protein n=1 Tax=Rhizophagus irregularis (strain DAOM 181602 / DAOM 197198 / MUCL 43194) TaxID=747089 RepID=U9UP12_RHIID